MYSWEFLSQFGPKNPPHIVLERSSKVQKDYDNYRSSSKNSTQSFLERIFPEEENKEIIIRQNDFPYNCEKSIQHKVVWIHPNSNITTEEIIDYIFKISKNIIYFENIEENKSIKAIRHFHVFIREDNSHL